MMLGGTKKINITRKVGCNKCSASGLKSGCVMTTCQKCDGKGMITMMRQMGPMISRQSFPCNTCNGSGNIINESDKCSKCKGAKYISEKKEYILDIPPGVKNGDCEILKNQGDESDKYIETGDIICIFKETREKNMQRIGNNLEIVVPILLSEALTGFSIPFKHPNNETIVIESDYVIQPDTKHKIDNLGFPSKKGSGDLIINFDIQFPKFNLHSNNLDEQKKIQLISKLLPKRKSVDLTNLNKFNIANFKEDLSAEYVRENMDNQDQGAAPECRQM